MTGSTPSVSATPNGVDTIIRFSGKVPNSVAEHCVEIMPTREEIEILEDKSRRNRPLPSG